MKRVLIILILVSNIALNAKEMDKPRERIHSVRKAVDTIGKLETKEVSSVDSLNHIFKDAKVTGQIRLMYDGYNQKEKGVDDNYATAIGGILRYELAEFKGFNAGVALYTAHDINSISGNTLHHNPELSSSKGSYTQLGESYINYTYKDFNFRVGRQVLNTPLADSDDIRIIQNTFNAYVATYNYQGFEFMAGNAKSWQGYDAGLEDKWVNIGDNGMNFVGVSYNDVWEFNIWYYNFTQNSNSLYFDGGIQYQINQDMLVHAVVQYLNEKELDKSGYNANIYGGSFEFVIDGLGFNIAYDKSDRKVGKQSFSGNGGGTLFTSMDTMILDNIAQDREADAFVSGLAYNYGDYNFLYAYGDFSGGSNTLGKKAHIVEQDIGVEYNFNDKFLISATYVMCEDKENSAKTEYDWNRTQLMINYNF